MLRTLLDASNDIEALSRKEQSAPEWRNTIEALLLVAENDGLTMFARIGFMKALNQHVERVFDPARKNHHWGKRKLKREN